MSIKNKSISAKSTIKVKKLQLSKHTLQDLTSKDAGKVKGGALVSRGVVGVVAC